MIVNRWWLETVWKPWLQSMMTSLWLSCKFWTANAILSFRSWTSRLDNNSAKGFVLVTWVYFWPEGFWPELFSSLAGITRPPFLKTTCTRTLFSNVTFTNSFQERGDGIPCYVQFIWEYLIYNSSLIEITVQMYSVLFCFVRCWL